MKVTRYKRSRSRVRNSVAVAAVGALAAGIVSIPAAPAHAADTITAADQAYFSYYGLDRARAKGLHGRGCHHRDDRWQGEYLHP